MENLSDDTCTGVFPDLYAYNPVEPESGRILIKSVKGTALKLLPELNSEEKGRLKLALVKAVRDMGECQIADRGCQNILVETLDDGEFKIGMIDGDWAWGAYSGNPGSTFDAENLFYANMAYLSEHILVFSNNNKKLFLDEILAAEYFSEITDPLLIKFFLVPKTTDNVGKFVYNNTGNSVVYRLMPIVLGKDKGEDKYKKSWKLISDFVLS